MGVSRLVRYFASTGAAPVSGMRAACGMLIAVACACLSPAFAQNAATLPNGSQVFMSSACFACHGQNGTGGVGPSFRGDPFLSLTDFVVAQILLGRGVMPPFGDKLNDQQIAAVATYIRNDWGNHFGEVKPQEVAQIRSQLKSLDTQTAMGHQ
jgi:mono/diheme cytochrome c family protein